MKYERDVRVDMEIISQWIVIFNIDFIQVQKPPNILGTLTDEARKKRRSRGSGEQTKGHRWYLHYMIEKTGSQFNTFS